MNATDTRTRTPTARPIYPHLLGRTVQRDHVFRQALYEALVAVPEPTSGEPRSELPFLEAFARWLEELFCRLRGAPGTSRFIPQLGVAAALLVTLLFA